MTSMTCEDLVELVTDHLDSALHPDPERRLRDHLTLCDGCERYLDQIRHTVDIVGALSIPPRPSHGGGVPLLDRPPEPTALTAVDGS
jgi:predicted anti-sigma-YlaC factor YlaD